MGVVHQLSRESVGNSPYFVKGQGISSTFFVRGRIFCVFENFLTAFLFQGVVSLLL